MRCLLSVSLCFALSVAEGHAADYRPGDQVVVIAHANLKVSGQTVVAEVWPGMVLKVRDVNCNWLWLSIGKPGWLPDSCVMPLGPAAIVKMNEEICNNPCDPMLYRGRADVRMKLGELNLALSDLNEAIRLDPTADAYCHRGMIRQEMKNYDEAIADFEESLRLAPSVPITYNNRALAWDALGRYNEAILDYNEAIRIDPNIAGVYYNRGGTWTRLNQLDKAVVDFDQAIRLDPKHAFAYSARGWARCLNGDFDKAVIDLDAALRIEPTLAWSYHRRGFVWFCKGDYDKAISDYSEAIRVTPLDSKTYFSRGEAWRYKLEYAKAAADYDAAIRLDSRNANLYGGRGLVRLALRMPEAVDDFQRAHEINPSNSLHAVLGNLSARLTNQPQRAAGFLAEKTEKFSHDWPYACVPFLKGEIEEGSVISQALPFGMTHESRCYLGLYQLASGNSDEAKRHFEAVRDYGNRINTEHSIAVSELARLMNLVP